MKNNAAAEAVKGGWSEGVKEEQGNGVGSVSRYMAGTKCKFLYKGINNLPITCP